MIMRIMLMKMTVRLSKIRTFAEGSDNSDSDLESDSDWGKVFMLPIMLFNKWLLHNQVAMPPK